MQQSVYGYYIPCSHVAILAAFAQEFNIEMAPILSKYQLTTESINTPGAMIAANQYTQLMLDVDTAVKNHDFWFYFGKQLDFPAYGVLGQALQSCENIQQAIMLLAKYYQLLSCGSELTCDRLDDFLCINIYRQTGIESRESIIRSEILVTTIINGMSALLPDGGAELKFEFDYKKPTYHGSYYKNLNRKCRFSADQSKILIPSQYLKLNCPHPNPVMLKILTQQLDLLLSQQQGPKSITAKVRTLIAKIPGNYPTLDDISQKIGMSPRTLSRRLKENNTTFQLLINEVKCQRASHYLQASNLPIEEIATLMGFNDSSSFRRAFTRWTGMIPTLFRKEKRLKQQVN